MYGLIVDSRIKQYEKFVQPFFQFTLKFTDFQIMKMWIKREDKKITQIIIFFSVLN